MRTLHLALLALLSAVLAVSSNSIIEEALRSPFRAEVAPAPFASAAPAVAAIDRERAHRVLGLQASERVTRPTATTAAPPPSITLIGTLEPHFATVVEPVTGRAVTARVGDVISGAELVAIDHGAITVRFAGSEHRLTTRRRDGPLPFAAQPGPSMQGTVSRAEIADALAHFPELARELRIIPAFVEGQYRGFKLFGVRAGSLLARAGLADGDVIRRINGIDASRPEQLASLLAQAGTIARVDLDLERGGRPLTTSVAIQ